MTKYLMCIHWGHICIFISNMKFLSLFLWLGGLCTHTNDADYTNNYARQTNHDYIGSFGRIPNEPIKAVSSLKSTCPLYQRFQNDCCPDLTILLHTEETEHKVHWAKQ